MPPRLPLLAGLAAATLLVAGLPVQAGIVTQDPCPRQPSVQLFALVPGATLENLVFDGNGRLYVTDAFAGRLLCFTPDGAMQVLLDEPGQAFTGPWSAPAAWTEFSPVFGANGLALDPSGRGLLAAITPDTGSPIVRVSFADGRDVRTVVQLAAGGVSAAPAVTTPDFSKPLLPKVLDDIALDPTGRYLFVTGHISNELLRVDLRTREACLVASGLGNPSAVRVARGFGAFDGKLFVTEFSGRLVVLDMP